jgi:hypothetical protein
MHYDMYSKNHAQDVTVAATYMSWNIWILHLDSILDIVICLGTFGYCI